MVAVLPDLSLGGGDEIGMAMGGFKFVFDDLLAGGLAEDGDSGG